MSERDLDARLDAVERALTDDDADLSDLRETTAALDDLSELESRMDDIETRLDELEAGLEAVRGYAGNVRAVNRDVERRASAALAKAETLESAVERTPSAPGATESDRGADARPADRSPPKQPTERDASGRGPADSTGVEPERGSGTERREVSTPASGPTTDPPRATGREPGGTDEAARSRADEVGETAGLRADEVDDEPSRRRSRRPGGDRTAAETGESADERGQTEQFIERVRDAL